MWEDASLSKIQSFSRTEDVEAWAMRAQFCSSLLVVLTQANFFGSRPGTCWEGTASFVGA